MWLESIWLIVREGSHGSGHGERAYHTALAKSGAGYDPDRTFYPAFASQQAAEGYLTMIAERDKRPWLSSCYTVIELPLL